MQRAICWRGVICRYYASIPYLTGHILQPTSEAISRRAADAGSFNPLPHGAHIATTNPTNSTKAERSFNPLPHGAHIATLMRGIDVSNYQHPLQSPTSRGTYCNPAPPPSAPGGRGFNPLPHGAHIATRHQRSAGAAIVGAASIPYLTGHILQLAHRLQRQNARPASIPYLTGHILQPIVRAHPAN